MKRRKKSKEPPSCPECGSTRVLPILYGFPSQQLMKEVKETTPPEVELGGCCIHPDSPDWSCQECEHRWQSDPWFSAVGEDSTTS